MNLALTHMPSSAALPCSKSRAITALVTRSSRSVLQNLFNTHCVIPAALGAEFVGSGGRWPDIARTLARERIIVPDAVDGTCLLWAFGTLIGNTDMHSGNLSFMPEQGRPYLLAPAYDMTPMAFAPTAGGDLPERRLPLHIGDQMPSGTWRQARPIAQAFVRRLEETKDLSDGFALCLAALQAHIQEAAERIGRLDSAPWSSL